VRRAMAAHSNMLEALFPLLPPVCWWPQGDQPLSLTINLLAGFSLPHECFTQQIGYPA